MDYLPVKGLDGERIIIPVERIDHIIELRAKKQTGDCNCLIHLVSGQKFETTTPAKEILAILLELTDKGGMDGLKHLMEQMLEIGNFPPPPPAPFKNPKS